MSSAKSAISTRRSLAMPRMAWTTATVMVRNISAMTNASIA